MPRKSSTAAATWTGKGMCFRKPLTGAANLNQPTQLTVWFVFGVQSRAHTNVGVSPLAPRL
jgi:hypothetical protein